MPSLKLIALAIFAFYSASSSEADNDRIVEKAKK
jgi:hypothetical protein